jgi:hypothetical protein
VVGGLFYRQLPVVYELLLKLLGALNPLHVAPLLHLGLNQRILQLSSYLPLGLIPMAVSWLFVMI